MKVTSMVKQSPGARIIRYFIGIVDELKKVVWLSRREVIYLTALVLLVAGLAGAVLGALDYGFTALIDKLILGR
ncbi:MAG: preprotein translocase subunit SecE [Dehalococcoidales bacterium]|nr:preprotein translocase subunit SecE [Dehalococcoidales bacterium]